MEYDGQEEMIQNVMTLNAMMTLLQTKVTEVMGILGKNKTIFYLRSQQTFIFSVQQKAVHKCQK